MLCNIFHWSSRNLDSLVDEMGIFHISLDIEMLSLFSQKREEHGSTNLRLTMKFLINFEVGITLPFINK